MKLSKILLGLAVVSVSILAYSCKKNEFRTNEYLDATGLAQIKVVCFSPDSANPSVQIYINDERVSNNVAITNQPFPGGGYNTGGDTYNGYLAIAPGNAKFRFVQATSYSSIITKDLFTTSVNLEPSAKQLVFLADTGVNRQLYAVKCETDRPDSGYAKIQFVNNMANTANIPISVVFNIKNTDTLMAHQLKFKDVKDFVKVPTYFSGATVKLFPSDSLKVGKSVSGKDSVYAPATALLGQSYVFNGLSNRKVYTCAARGIYKSTNTVALPKVSFIIVQ
ncbi:MAG: DUF4397 domain-containing protein [Filimonas sp.]|nr:DUF4397 domain-containing protein [Filimonas sp.]